MPQYNEGKVLWLILTECDVTWEPSDEAWCRMFLRKLVEEIRMTCLPAGCAYTFSHPDRDKAGVSATQILAESHVSIHPIPSGVGEASTHTWPEARSKPCLTIVVYSCRNFRTDRVVKYVQRILRPEIIDVRETERKYVLCKGRKRIK